MPIGRFATGSKDDPGGSRAQTVNRSRMGDGYIRKTKLFKSFSLERSLDILEAYIEN